MATSAIEYITVVGSKISGDHGSGLYGTHSVSCASDYSADRKTATSVFSLPSLNLAKTLVLTSLNLLVTTYSITDGASGGYSYAFIIEGTTYTCDSNGYLASGGITHLNNYKAQNGVFPDVTVQVTSWVSRPPANEDGTAQSYSHSVKFSDYTIQATIQGGVLILRPNADISAEHTIPSGFTGVYQLLNEEVADDGATDIGDSIEAKTDEKVESTLTSVVSLAGGSFSKKNIVLMRPVSRHKIINPTMNGSASIACSVIVGDISNTFTDNVSTEGYVTNEKWNLLSKSPVVQEVISYAKTNKVLPEIRLSLCTDLSSSGSAIKSGGKASAYITQAYLEIIYEDALSIGVSHKVGGEWKSVQTAYEKRNGAWVEISEEECKAILQNSLVTRS